MGVPFRQAEPTLFLFTDASNRGWGAHIQELSTKGFWTYPYCTKHINILEMTAVLLALQHFEERIWGKSVLIATDNSTVVSYINKQGGTHSRAICDLASDLWFWASARDITLKARHIAGRSPSSGMGITSISAKSSIQTLWNTYCGSIRDKVQS